MKGFEKRWSLFSSDVFVDSEKKMKAHGVRWEGQAERTPFPLPIVHRELTSILIEIASGGLCGGDSRVVVSLLSTL